MQQYLDLLAQVLAHGEVKKDRTGVGTISMFGLSTIYNIQDGFPLLTTKKVNFNGVLRELLWFLKGSTNINDNLKEYTPIWNDWADENGNLGPIYGYQWRYWEKFEFDPKQNQYIKSHIDQIKNIIHLIKTNPDSRRIILTAWNVADLDKMALPPCHMMCQFYVRNAQYLDCNLYQRSADLAIGVPFNIASYALLTMMLAKECNLEAGRLIHSFGDVHIYQNHVEAVKLQLTRSPGQLPTVNIAKKAFFDLTFEDFELVNYVHQGFIKLPIAV